ncbi:PspC domain-containing protein [Altererythrobacter arenosus]|uniref:PspC domain-containing protein n=1 Tax=Altererythrobacter arenosus TaxID=3032592 RepID=A0ABY8FQT6_9SPHN|nr:PspC domain-containing protein [Altererythrobacter sp. CAU 1644]WFL76475.1 PspC domain-containing protein [Altererythrobacter sp. CAU 1644]
MNDVIRSTDSRPAKRGFHLDKRDAKIFGVCAGIADYFGINAMWVRIGFAAGTIIGFGSLILVYLAIALIAD